MSDKELYRDLDTVFGKDQLKANDEDATNVLEGVYEGIDEDELNSVMDAEADKADEEMIPDAEAELSRGIVAECQGVEANGAPRSSVGISLEMVQADMATRETIAQHTVYKPVVSINNRYEFVEISLTYPVENDNDMKVIWSHLEKYGQLLNQVTETSVRAPLFTLVLVPLSGMCVYYMSAYNPIIWIIEPDKPGGKNNRLSLLYHCEDISFYSSDDMDMENIAASAIRAVEQEAEETNAKYEYEERMAAEREERNRRMEDLRRKNRGD